MENYFKTCETVADVKKLYRELAKENHPDHGGSTRTMQIINDLYHAKLRKLDGQTSIGTDKKKHQYHYNHVVEQELIDKINELLKIKMIDVEMELIGTWLWVKGDTKKYRKEFKKLKLCWHPKRNAWYYRKYDYRRKMSNLSFDQLRQMYGSKDIDQEEKQMKKALKK